MIPEPGVTSSVGRAGPVPDANRHLETRTDLEQNEAALQRRLVFMRGQRSGGALDLVAGMVGGQRPGGIRCRNTSS